jgi:hypothetical protein
MTVFRKKVSMLINSTINGKKFMLTVSKKNILIPITNPAVKR